MFLLDTDIISELRKAKTQKANSGVAEWAAALPPALMFMSVVSLHELELGVLLAERRDPEQGQLLRSWIDTSVAPAFRDRILPVTVGVARQAAALNVLDPAPFRDALIAATALHHDMTLATKNPGSFERFAGLQVLNPWT